MMALRLIALGAFATLFARPVLAAAPTKSQCLSSNESAQSLRASGKLREARAQLLICAAKTCPRLVRNDCAEWLTEVDKATPTIVFEAKDGAGNDLSSVHVTMDGEPLTDKLDGSAIPMDPGEHRFAFEADGVPKTEKTIVARAGDKDRHVLAVLGAAPPAAAGAVASPATTSPSDGSSQRTIGLVLGGAGIVGLLVGTVLRLKANSDYGGVLRSDCNGSVTGCNSSAVSDEQSPDNEARISTVAFVAGGALLAGGAVLYFTAPKADSIGIAPTVGTSGAGLSIKGVW
jgi:hypothetical protein